MRIAACGPHAFFFTLNIVVAQSRLVILRITFIAVPDRIIRVKTYYKYFLTELSLMIKYN